MADEPKPDQAAPPDEDRPEQATPADALSKTNEELGNVAGPAAPQDKKEEKPAKKPNPLKAFLKRFNIYLLLFILVAVISLAVAIVAYLNSKKEPVIPDLNNTTLDAETLRQLANSDATVGSSGQTLTVQGNAIISGQLLVRNNLNVAGTIQLGGSFNVPRIIVSDTANLADTQINTLQIAGTTTAQGEVALQGDLNVAGASSFSGPVTIGNLSVVKLTMSGNGQLEIPNHINFTGAPPARVMNAGMLGAGGSAAVGGSDTTGTININTGDNPTAGCFIRIRFNIPYENTPHVLISPVNAGAAQTQYYVVRTNTQFELCTLNAPPANQAFAFDYFVTGI